LGAATPFSLLIGATPDFAQAAGVFARWAFSVDPGVPGKPRNAVAALQRSEFVSRGQFAQTHRPTRPRL